MQNLVALQRAEMRMVRWMCGVKLKDRLPSKELRERLGVDDIALVLQQNRLHWYGHVLRKEDGDWEKKCMEYEVEGPRPRGRPKRTWKAVVQEDCQARKLNKEEAIDRCKWRNMIKDVRWLRWVWVGECYPGPKAVKRLCVSVSSSFVPKDVLEGHLYCWMEWVCAVHGCWEKSFFIILLYCWLKV